MPIKLQKTEYIVNIARRHGIVYFWWWLLVFLFISIPFFFMFWLFHHGWWGQTLFFISLALAFFIFIRTIFLWKKKTLVITTRRIIDVDQRGFFDKIITEIPFEHLDYVSGQVKGMWGTLWRYGSLSIQNESGNMRIVFDKLKRPLRIQGQINELRKKYGKQSDGGSMCVECGEKQGNIVDVLADKFKTLELQELIKLKKVLSGKIDNFLAQSDNKK